MCAKTMDENLVELFVNAQHRTIDTMEAGKDLNHAVAHAVGWKVAQWGPALVVEHDGKGWPDFNPSGNMACAWDVVDRIRMIYGLWFFGCFDAKTHPTEPWVCVFKSKPHTHGGKRKMATGDSMPLAICRAALKATASQKNQEG
jgi:Phage ABA sandwich domain